MSDDGLTPLRSTLDEVFRRMGLSHPEVMSRLVSDWDELAGSPWSGRSKPVVIRDNTLVVEATAASMVAFLRYGSTELVATLEKALGTGVITRIEVQAPRRPLT